MLIYIGFWGDTDERLGMGIVSSGGHFYVPKIRRKVTRQCRDCLQEFPLSDQYFPVRKVKPSGDQVLAWNCHECETRFQAIKEAYLASPEGQAKLARKQAQQRRAIRITSHKRRARQHGFTAVFTQEDETRMVAYWRGCCAYCGRKSDQLTFDHYIPLSDTSSLGTVVANILPACQSCNSSKSSLFPTIWLARKYGQEKANETIAAIQTYFDWAKETK